MLRFNKNLGNSFMQKQPIVGFCERLIGWIVAIYGFPNMNKALFMVLAGVG